MPTGRRSLPCSTATWRSSASTGPATWTTRSTDVQRINYDTALNGRISVFGKTGNDHFYVDDTTATISLDGGAGFDTFQVGQIFGTKRDEAEGAILPVRRLPRSDRDDAGLAEPRHARTADRAGRNGER